MHVTKVVELVAKNPEQLRLHFYDFSMSSKRIYKFNDLSCKLELGFAVGSLETC